MVKLQQYYIIKTTSTRLKNSHYNIKMDIKQARKNGEAVSIGESQMIRTLFNVMNKNIDPSYVSDLFEQKRKIKNKKSSPENSHMLASLEASIDKELFIPEICSVVIDNNKHYQKMVDNGFFINDRRYVRLLSGSGQSRRNTVLFIDEKYESDIKKRLNNDRNEDVEISPAKFNAYFALCSSATLTVSEPYFCVVNDAEIKRKELVEFVEEHDPDDSVYQKEMELDFNLFDGMGLISPNQAKIWANDLGLDYVPSAFIIRNSFMKGMVAVFDFHEFAEINEKRYFDDVWGNKTDVKNIEVIISESQLKLWNTFESNADYVDKCRKNGLVWGVSRYTPKEESQHVFSNYQFLQVEDLNKDDIENLCSKTIDYFNTTIKDDINHTILYLLGKNSTKSFDKDILNKIADPATKALILNNYLINDPYIKNHIIRSMNKKIRESYIGNLLLDGNYQIMISDPYAMAEHVFGMPVVGLLGKDEHYSNYWNAKKVGTVAGFRAPLTWKSEVNILNLKNDARSRYWYKHLSSGIVYNVHGYDVMLHAD